MNTATKLLSVILLLCAFGLAQDLQTQPAADTHFNIAANDMHDAPFTVGDEVMEVRLTGTFTATGGRASKIIVLVMTDAQFAKWQSSHSPTPSTPANGGALYNSGEVSQAKIDLQLPDTPANYHLVFSNIRFPYPKAIQTDLTWQWKGVPEK